MDSVSTIPTSDRNLPDDLGIPDIGEDRSRWSPLPPSKTELAAELGRVRYERDLLLHGVQNYEHAMTHGWGPAALHALFSVARFVEDGGVAALNGGHGV